MDLLAIIRIAMRALARNKMRSVLTMLGIIIGVGAVIAMVGVGQGAQLQAQQQIAAMGSNMLFVQSGTVNTRWHAHGLGRHQDTGLRRHGGHPARVPVGLGGRPGQPVFRPGGFWKRELGHPHHRHRAAVFRHPELAVCRGHVVHAG